ncbi:MAG: hypothetical protein V1802_00715 [Candidatus Aenigmatarchaeota archaeon]
MSVEVKINKERIIVPSGAVTYIVDELLAGHIGIDKARRYVAMQRQNECLHHDLGYVDFDNLTDGKPTIVGDFYKTNTRFGLKISGNWEETFEKLTKK